MAAGVPQLAAEERRRQLTLVALGAGLFMTTIPVADQRALFSPLGDVPMLGDLSPVAYAVTFGTTGDPAGRRGGNSPRVAGGSPNPPVAFAARIPDGPFGDAPPAAGIPNAVPAAVAPPSNPAFPNSPAPPAFPPVSQPGPLPQPNPLSDTSNPAPPNPTLPVPEPATWLTLICGFGIVGGLMRRARRKDSAAVATAMAPAPSGGRVSEC